MKYHQQHAEEFNLFPECFHLDPYFLTLNPALVKCHSAFLEVGFQSFLWMLFFFAEKPTWSLRWDFEWLMRGCRRNVSWLSLMVNTFCVTYRKLNSFQSLKLTFDWEEEANFSFTMFVELRGIIIITLN